MGLEKIYGGKPLDGNLEDFERRSVYDESRQASINKYYDKIAESRRKSEQKAQLKQTVWARIKNKYTSMSNENSTDEIIQAAEDLMQNSHQYSYYGDYMMESIYFDGNPYENDRKTMAQHLKTLLEYKYNEAMEHIELPENEQISTRIHQKIEELEKFAHLPNSHKGSIAQIQGLESKELFSLIDTFQKKSAGAFARPSLSDMQEINSQISKRLEYLESKLSILMENKEIDGNEERISDIEKQISSIRGVWTEVVKSNTEKILAFQAKNIVVRDLYSQISEPLIGEAQARQKAEQDRVKEQLCGLIGNENLSERFEAEEQARLKAEQEAKEKVEEQARLKAEQEAKEKAEEQARQKAEQEAKEKAEEQARIKAEQEAKEKAEEQARLKAEQEAKAKAEEQARLKAEQEAKEKAEEQARLKAEQEAKEKAEEQARLKAEQEAKEKAEEQARLKAEQEAQEKAEEQARLKAEQEAQAKAEEQARLKAEQEAQAKAEEQARTEMNARSMYDHWKFMADFEKNGHYDNLIFKEAEKLTKLYPENAEYRDSFNQLKTKVYEQQQPEKIKPREKSIKDEVGDEELRETKTQVQKQANPSVDLWMNRFNGWYSAIDRVSQSVKDKFVKMKSDIIKAISEKLKERTNNRQVNTQEQDTNER